jgi:2-dehydropantoate 2-reductase
MHFLVAGAGAIGGYLGARLAQKGEKVTLFARGPHLKAMQERGLRVRSGEGDFEVHPRVIGSLDDVGAVDVLAIGVKAHGLTALAPHLTPLIGPQTVVVSTQNGIPWWYMPLESVDPGGVIARSIPAQQVVGSIAYIAADIVEPGVIRHVEGDRLTLGEPDGSKSERLKALSQILINTGMRAPVSERIHTEIWVKILGNVAFNPISALTRATLGGMVRDDGVRNLVTQIMREVEAVGAKLGIAMPISIEQRIAGAGKVGEHKTSMLQDLEAGRSMELEPVVGAVLELGDRLGVAMPHTRTVYACTKLMDELSRKETK